LNRVDCIRWCGIVLLSLAGNLWAQKLEICTYSGNSDPSAAAAVNERYFVVGDDEHNILRVYSISGSSAPVFSVDVTDFLKADAKHPEADIEGAARLGERIYWITSHGRNKDGQIRPSRYRFFATEIKVADALTEPNRPPQIVPVGNPYPALVSDMLASSRLSSLNLHNITRLGEPLSGKERQQLAPKEKGLNIEGLAVGPDGRSLWIGLRNPLYEDAAGKRKAIVIPLLNPAEVVDQGKTARFGDVILLDLDGRGIRSIDYVETQKEYWIVAGPAGSQADFALFRYHYADKKLATVKVDFPKDFTPEGLFILPGQKTIWFISDDGTFKKEVSSPDQCLPGQLLEDGRCPNKCLCDLDKRTFRVLRYDPMTP
jgi:hypothetical protein